MDGQEELCPQGDVYPLLTHVLLPHATRMLSQGSRGKDWLFVTPWTVVSAHYSSGPSFHTRLCYIPEPVGQGIDPQSYMGRMHVLPLEPCSRYYKTDFELHL